MVIEWSSQERYAPIVDLGGLRENLGKLNDETRELSERLGEDRLSLKRDVASLAFTNFENSADLPAASASRLVRLHEANLNDLPTEGRAYSNARIAMNNYAQSLIITDPQAWIEQSLETLKVILERQKDLAKTVYEKLNKFFNPAASGGGTISAFADQ